MYVLCRVSFCLCITCVGTLASGAKYFRLLSILDNITLLKFRCKCGNCNVALLQNISECKCFLSNLRFNLVYDLLCYVGYLSRSNSIYLLNTTLFSPLC